MCQQSRNYDAPTKTTKKDRMKKSRSIRRKLGIKTHCSK